MITNEPTEKNFIDITGIEAKMEQIDETVKIKKTFFRNLYIKLERKW